MITSLRPLIIVIVLAAIWTCGFYYSHITYSPDVWKTGSTNGMNYGFTDIFKNNALMVVKNMLSFVLLGIPALINVFLNGYIFGLHFEMYKACYSDSNLILFVMPYAIFEIAGLFLSVYISVMSTYYIIDYILNDRKLFLQRIIAMFRYAIVTLILILMGAFIESIIIEHIK